MTSATTQARADVDDVSKKVEARERKPRCAAAHGRHVVRVISGIEPLNGAWRCVQSSTALRLSRLCRSAQDDLCGTFTTVIGAIFAAVMQRVVVCVV